MARGTGPNFQESFATYQRGAFLEAALDCRRLAALDPAGGAVLHLLSLALFQVGRAAEAEFWLRQAAIRAIGAELVDIRINQAAARLALGRHDDALASVALALELDPAKARGYSTRADILRDRLRPVEALRAGRQAASLEPGRDETWTSIGNALQSAGHIPEALGAYARSMAISPNSVVAHGNRQFTLCFAETANDRILFEAARAWGRVIEVALPPSPRWKPARRDRLRIGYHAFEFFRRSAIDDYFPPVLKNHDRQRFEIVLVADGGRRDRRTEELRALADRWIDLAGLDLPGKVERLRAAELDIAVCLTGYLPAQRLVFAPRVAPVQVALINHVATTGMAAFDYRVTDRWLDPPGATEAWNTERLVRLSHGYLTAQPPENAPEVPPLPARAKGHVTFGSFNNLSKVTPGTLALWSGVLAALPGSRLLLKARALEDPGVRARYLDLAAGAGIEPRRIDIIGAIPDEAGHLSALARADIALDPVPFGGGRTTVETLLMGVPVVNLRRPMIMGRLGDSMLSRAGLGHLVADSPQAFVETTVSLARDLDRLEDVRMGLRARLLGSTLCDAAGYTRELEDAYVSMIDGTA